MYKAIPKPNSEETKEVKVFVPRYLRDRIYKAAASHSKDPDSLMHDVLSNYRSRLKEMKATPKGEKGTEEPEYPSFQAIFRSLAVQYPQARAMRDTIIAKNINREPACPELKFTVPADLAKMLHALKGGTKNDLAYQVLLALAMDTKYGIDLTPQAQQIVPSQMQEPVSSEPTSSQI